VKNNLMEQYVEFRNSGYTIPIVFTIVD
jgi:hypothetical protein